MDSGYLEVLEDFALRRSHRRKSGSSRDNKASKSSSSRRQHRQNLRQNLRIIGTQGVIRKARGVPRVRSVRDPFNTRLFQEAQLFTDDWDDCPSSLAIELGPNPSVVKESDGVDWSSVMDWRDEFGKGGCYCDTCDYCPPSCGCARRQASRPSSPSDSGSEPDEAGILESSIPNIITTREVRASDYYQSSIKDKIRYARIRALREHSKMIGRTASARKSWKRGGRTRVRVAGLDDDTLGYLHEDAVLYDSDDHSPVSSRFSTPVDDYERNLAKTKAKRQKNRVVSSYRNFPGDRKPKGLKRYRTKLPGSSLYYAPEEPNNGIVKGEQDDHVLDYSIYGLEAPSIPSFTDSHLSLPEFPRLFTPEYDSDDSISCRRPLSSLSSQSSHYAYSDMSIDTHFFSDTDWDLYFNQETNRAVPDDYEESIQLDRPITDISSVRYVRLDERRRDLVKSKSKRMRKSVLGGWRRVRSESKPKGRKEYRKKLPGLHFVTPDDLANEVEEGELAPVDLSLSTIVEVEEPVIEFTMSDVLQTVKSSKPREPGFEVVYAPRHILADENPVPDLDIEAGWEHVWNDDLLTDTFDDGDLNSFSSFAEVSSELLDGMA